MPIEGNCWVSSAFEPRSPERSARDAMKFVKVVLVDGYLTDISISMIMVELKRRGVKLSNGTRETPNGN